MTPEVSTPELSIKSTAAERSIETKTKKNFISINVLPKEDIVEFIERFRGSAKEPGLFEQVVGREPNAKDIQRAAKFRLSALTKGNTSFELPVFGHVKNKEKLLQVNLEQAYQDVDMLRQKIKTEYQKALKGEFDYGYQLLAKQKLISEEVDKKNYGGEFESGRKDLNTGKILSSMRLKEIIQAEVVDEIVQNKLTTHPVYQRYLELKDGFKKQCLRKLLDQTQITQIANDTYLENPASFKEHGIGAFLPEKDIKLLDGCVEDMFSRMQEAVAREQVKAIDQREVEKILRQVLAGTGIIQQKKVEIDLDKQILEEFIEQHKLGFFELISIDQEVENQESITTKFAYLNKDTKEVLSNVWRNKDLEVNTDKVKGLISKLDFF